MTMQSIGRWLRNQQPGEFVLRTTLLAVGGWVLTYLILGIIFPYDMVTLSLLTTIVWTVLYHYCPRPKVRCIADGIIDGDTWISLCWFSIGLVIMVSFISKLLEPGIWYSVWIGTTVWGLLYLRTLFCRQFIIVQPDYVAIVANLSKQQNQPQNDAERLSQVGSLFGQREVLSGVRGKRSAETVIATYPLKTIQLVGTLAINDVGSVRHDVSYQVNLVPLIGDIRNLHLKSLPVSTAFFRSAFEARTEALFAEEDGTWVNENVEQFALEVSDLFDGPNVVSAKEHEYGLGVRDIVIGAVTKNLEGQESAQNVQFAENFARSVERLRPSFPGMSDADLKNLALTLQDKSKATSTSVSVTGLEKASPITQAEIAGEIFGKGERR